MDSLVWNASWIGPGAHARDDLGVFGFRCRFDLASPPSSFKVRLSADQRYKLYVNGEMVVFGPQRGDEKHWFYETVDIGPYLQEGENWIAALVWNFGRMAPMAQHTVRTGFVFEGLDLPELSTPGNWEVARLPGWDFEMMNAGLGDAYIDVGPGEILRSGPSSTFDAVVGEPGRDLEYSKPHRICQAEERGASGGGTPWMLIPRSIPLMKYEHSAITPTEGESEEVTFEAERVLKNGEHLLLDYGELLCAFPQLFVSCEGRATVTLTYDEALWSDEGKGNRNEIKGKESRGYQDKIELDGWSLVFEPLWWRTYRFLRIDVQGDPVKILDLQAIETGYPLQIESAFDADDPIVKPIWDVSVRTAERCAGETYFDCPYYEQLQYVGDTRIQALIGYYLGRDRALQRNAVETLGWSIMENGLTQSRYPSRQAQVIPPFSLWWVMVLYDQMLYDTVGRPALAIQPYQFAERVLDGFQSLHEQPEFWQFVDWVPEWRWGVPPDSLRHPIENASRDLAEAAAGHFGFPDGDCDSWAKMLLDFQCSGADSYTNSDWADLVRHGDELATANGGLLVPPEQSSEHLEALWRQLHPMIGQLPPAWPTESLEAAKAAKCTYYFSYYKHLAMFGRPESGTDWTSGTSEPTRTNPNKPEPTYLEQLAPWKEMIENGLTTFAETPEPTRSDCHAWSAHPILGFFQIIAGVTSIAPGWAKAKIMPHPGDLRRFKASIVHPDGELRVDYEMDKFTISSPVPFEFRWREKHDTFPAGTHSI